MHGQPFLSSSNLRAGSTPRPGFVGLGSELHIANLWIALYSLQSAFSFPLSFWQAFKNGNTLLNLNLKILRAVSLQNYVLGVFIAVTLERGLDTGRRHMGSGPSPETDRIN